MFRSLCFLCFLGFASVGHSAEWRKFSNEEGKSFVGMPMELDGEFLTMKRKKDGKTFMILLTALSEPDQEWILKWSKGTAPKDAPRTRSGKLSKKLYPKTKDEIRTVLKEINSRKKEEWMDKAQHKAMTELNTYRYLSGVPYDSVATEKKVKEATMAAAACNKAGKLSHGLGDFTNKTNLYSSGDIVRSVRVYIDDFGANNRERRGHRRWCLNPAMKRTGFGSSGNYSAMWSLDMSGPKNKKSWAYPGKGFFPKERLHGNAWSLYLTENAPAKDKLKVEVYKLRRLPEKSFTITEEIPGKALDVPFVFTYGNTINFEPSSKKIEGRGYYWVRIKGGGVREQYVVALY